MRGVEKVSFALFYLLLNSCLLVYMLYIYLELHDLAAKRLKNQMERQKDSLIRFIPPEKRGVVSKIAPEYALKGAARAASEHYQDPNYIPPTEAINLFSQLGCHDSETSSKPPGDLYSHPEGRVLLRYMIEYGTFLHNKMEKTRDAIRVFNDMLRYDKNDHLVSSESMHIPGILSVVAVI